MLSGGISMDYSKENQHLSEAVTNDALANVNIHPNPCNVSPNSSFNSLGKAIMDVRIIVV